MTTTRLRRLSAVVLTAAALLSAAACTGETESPTATPTTTSPPAFVPVKATAAAVYPDEITIPGGLKLTLAKSWDLDGCPEAEPSLDALLKGCQDRAEAIYVDEDKKVVVAFAVLNFAPGSGDKALEVIRAKQADALGDYPNLKGSTRHYWLAAEGAFGHVVWVNVGPGDGVAMDDVKKWTDPSARWLADSLEKLK